MEAIKTRGIAKNGMLTVAVPQRFEEQELEVIVLNNSVIEDWDEAEEWKQKVARRLSIIGSAKNSNAPIDDYDVYDQ